MSQDPLTYPDGPGPPPAPHAGVEDLARQVAELRRRLEEAEETIRAIREDEVDAFVVSRGEADRVLTLESADRPYRRYVEAMRQAAVTLSRDGTILYANRAFAQLVMRPVASVVGGSIGSYMANSCHPVLDEVIARRPDGRGEALIERSDGVVVPVHLTASGSTEEPDVVCLVITDLTDQRRLAEVTEEERLSRSILEQTVDAIVVVDRSGVLIRAGAAARRLCGKDPIGLAFDTAFPLCPCPRPDDPRDETAASSWVGRVLSGETIRGAEVCLERGDGQSLQLLLGSGPVTDAGGSVIGFVATFTDITELRRVEDELREADRRKDEFLAMLAHELRNPLSAIHHAVQVARDSPGDGEARSWSEEIIERQARQLGHLVDDLLDVSRISRGKFQLRKELIDARTVVERAVQVVRPQVTEKGLELRLSIHEGPMVVEVDPTRLEQILINLLGNAAKYTDAPGRIMLSARPGSGELVLLVEDTGIGISPEKLPLVFELFEQVEHSIDRSRGGLGIGLTLVRRLVEMHGGAVSAESDGLGRGSSFIVRLPLAEQDLQAGMKAEGRPSETHADARILVVDDNVDSVVGLARLLRSRGYEVETAHDGPSALEAAAARRPAFVLLDIGLPGMDGYQVAERLRALLGERVVICALSGYGREEDRRRGKDAGFDHHLIKPVDLNEIMSVLADAGGRKPTPGRKLGR